jgi:hypothetical protein
MPIPVPDGIGIPCIPSGPPIPVPDGIGIPYIPVGQKKPGVSRVN